MGELTLSNNKLQSLLHSQHHLQEVLLVVFWNVSRKIVYEDFCEWSQGPWMPQRLV